MNEDGEKGPGNLLVILMSFGMLMFKPQPDDTDEQSKAKMKGLEDFLIMGLDKAGWVLTKKS